jgi:deazaflavin-dependent oxidoreductase (nitroreductase family)
MRGINSIAARRIRRTNGRLMGTNALVLSTIGGKTGAERTNPLACFPQNDGSWWVVASAGGAPANPAWYYNIAAHPDRVQVEFDGGRVAVTPRQLDGEERAAAWRAIVASSPQFAKYEKATDRVMPVIELTPSDVSRAVGTRSASD